MRVGLGKIFCLFISLNAVAHESDHSPMLRMCRETIGNLERVNRVAPLLDCWDFYWHGGDPEDTVHGYDRILQLGERLVTIAPAQSSAYGDLAWLYWSRWRETREDADSLPQLAQYLKRAEDLLRRGASNRSNRRDFRFLADAGFTIFFIKKDIPTLIPLMRQLWTDALSAANYRDPEEKQISVNVAKQLGYHYLKDLLNKERALYYFRYAVRLQPDNPGAVRMVEELERELGLRP